MRQRGALPLLLFSLLLLTAQAEAAHRAVLAFCEALQADDAGLGQEGARAVEAGRNFLAALGQFLERPPDLTGAPGDDLF